MAKRRALAFEEKLKIISEIDKGLKQVDAAKKYGISQSTIATFLKKRKEIEGSVEKSRVDSKRKRFKSAVNGDVDKATLRWFNEMRAQNVPISGPMISEQSRKFASMLGHTDFKASNGWLSSFRDRHGIVFKTIAGEEKSAPVDDALSWKQKEKEKIEKLYSPHDVYNADETGLFYQLMPDKTMAFKGESCKGGKKSKQRLTVLLCSNSTGTDKLKPLVIGKYARPRCFKNVKSLPVDYLANKKAWMTEEIFNNWLINLDKDMKKKKKKIALIVDNCTPHNNPPSLKHIKVFYFPPNCTSLLQPLDLGIIKCFKGYYRKRLLQNVVYNLEAKLLNPFAVDVKNACDWVSGSWNSVTASTIQNCWKKASFFEENNDDHDVMEISDEEECVCNLATAVSAFQSSSNLSFPLNAEDFLNLDNDVLVFSGASDEDIIADLTPCEESDEEEVADCSQDKPPISVQNAISLINTLQDYVSTLPNVSNVHLNSLEGLKHMCMQVSLESTTKQTKLTDYFSEN